MTGVLSVAFSPNGETLASGSLDGTVRLWTLSNSALAANVIELFRSKERASVVAFSPDGRTLATGYSEGTVRLWNLSGSVFASTILSGREHYVSSIAFSPDGKTLVWGDRISKVWMWNVTDPDPSALPFVNSTDPGGVMAVAFSPDGRTLAVANSDGKVRLSNPDDPDVTPTDLRYFTQASSMAFSPDVQILASANIIEDAVSLWDLTDSDPDNAIFLADHEVNVYSVAFSPDGSTLATGSQDGTVRLWDLTDLAGRPIVLFGHRGPVNSVAFSPDGQVLASGSTDDTIRLWITRTDLLSETVCDKVTRNLTTDEWLQLVSPEIPYVRTCPNLPSGEGGASLVETPE
jgi:WD40 repeat protein